MNVRQMLLTLLCVSMPVLLFAQSDSAKQKIPLFKRPPNSTKLELVYDRQEVSDSRYGRYEVFRPGVRIDNSRPRTLDNTGDILRKYYTRAPLAGKKLDEADRQRRRGTAFLIPGLVGAPIALFTGLGVAIKKDKVAPLGVGFGLATAMATTSIVMKWRQNKKAEELVRASIAVYNEMYYKPVVTDSAVQSALAKYAAKDSVPKIVPRTEKNLVNGAPIYRDTVDYVLQRNAPENSGMYGIIVSPFIMNVDFLNFNFRGGIGAFYTYKSDFGASVQYDIAYLDNLGGEVGTDQPYYGHEERGIPVKYQRASRLELQFKTPLFRFMKQGRYRMEIAGNSVGYLEGDVMRAITARAGYIIDRKLLDGQIGYVPFQTNTPGYVSPSTGEASTFPYLDISTAMMRSNIVTVGLAWSKFRDMKIKLTDPVIRGRRMEKTQSDLYIDLLYAHQLKLQDMIYYHSVWNENRLVPQRLDLNATPMRKVGARIGIQRISSGSEHWGFKSGVELGLNPGPRIDRADDLAYIKISLGVMFGGRKSFYK